MLDAAELHTFAYFYDISEPCIGGFKLTETAPISLLTIPNALLNQAQWSGGDVNTYVTSLLATGTVHALKQDGTTQYTNSIMAYSEAYVHPCQLATQTFSFNNDFVTCASSDANACYITHDLSGADTVINFDTSKITVVNSDVKCTIQLQIGRVQDSLVVPDTNIFTWDAANNRLTVGLSGSLTDEAR